MTISGNNNKNQAPTEEMPFVWNLTFPNGSSSPHFYIQRILSEDMELPVTSIIPTDLDPSSWESQPIAPGLFISDSAVRAIKDGVFAQFKMVNRSSWREEILFGNYGYHPIPNPNTFPDWGTDDCVYAGGHPVYWLPAEVRDINFWADPRFEPHRESLEQIRLAMELFIRGFYNIETGEFLDVLVTAGIDGGKRHEEIKEAFLSSKEGMPNDLFNSLVLPYPEDEAEYGSAARLVSAIYALEVVRSNFGNIKSLIVDNLNERSIIAMENFRLIDNDNGEEAFDTTVPLMMQALESASKVLLQSSQSEQDFKSYENVALGRVEALEDILFDSYLPMRAQITRRQNGFFASQNIKDELFTHQKELYNQIKSIESRVNSLCVDARMVGASGISDKLTEIWNIIGAETTHILNLTADMWDKSYELGPVTDEEYPISEPPALSIPEDAQAGLNLWNAQRASEFASEIESQSSF